MGKEFNPVPIFESAVGGLFGMYETEQVNEENAARQARQNQWQSQENEKNRQFQRDMFHEQFQAQQEEWDRQQAYNTPVNQVQRANAAGFNPSATLAGGQGGLVDSTISIPSPSVPSGSSSAPGSPIPSQRIGFADMIRSVGSVIKDVSSAGLDDSNRRLINETMSDTIYGMKLDNATKEINNALLGITYEINNKTKQNKILDLNAQFDKTMAVIALTKAQGDTEVVKAALTKAEEIKAYADANLSEAEAKSVIACIDGKVNLLKEQAKTEQARQSELYSSSFKLRAEGITENELRPLRKLLADFQQQTQEEIRRGARFDNLIKSTTWIDQANIIIEKADQARLITRQEKVKLSRAMKENDMVYLDHFFNWLGQGAGAFRDFGIGSSALGKGKTMSTPVDSPWTIYGGSEGATQNGF